MNTPGSGTPLLSLKGVSKRYGGVVALSETDVDVRQGEILAVLGSNGAGKSTLMKLMCGAEPTDTGEIVFDGEQRPRWDIATSRGAGVEVVYQELGVVGQLSPIENLFLGREQVRFKGVGGLLARRRMNDEGERLLKELGVRLPSLKVKIDELSGGQRQAVAIARAIGWGKKLVILDEPTAALGIAEAAEVERLILQLKDRGLSVVLVSHRLDQVKQLADRVVVVRHGRIVGRLAHDEIKVGTLAELITGDTQAEVM